MFTFNRINLTEQTLLLNLVIASSQLCHWKKIAIASCTCETAQTLWASCWSCLTLISFSFTY